MDGHMFLWEKTMHDPKILPSSQVISAAARSSAALDQVCISVSMEREYCDTLCVELGIQHQGEMLEQIV